MPGLKTNSAGYFCFFLGAGLSGPLGVPLGTVFGAGGGGTGAFGLVTVGLGEYGLGLLGLGGVGTGESGFNAAVSTWLGKESFTRKMLGFTVLVLAGFPLRMASISDLSLMLSFLVCAVAARLQAAITNTVVIHVFIIVGVSYTINCMNSSLF